ncbi:hypothetical protein Mycch_0763 [Mycolicibacterium chubuense NBB4]|uniref:Uncharacterized protein n=1 Tax=Mycolicibacterium chubuense (strain NBB4) TaxID=710421 RepID=I4BE73_MYCCN|nr:hypothetical protein [Mycolicibacterium chubuense]AFM15580.1 hypothetical protein Mycch_0763 [Mycolicibacterium chubuense NBB4]
MSIVGIAGTLLLAPGAAADPDAAPVDPAVDPGAPPVQVAAPGNPNADPMAVTACSQFAEVLDSTSTYYSDFTDSLNGFATENYSDPSVSSSNVLGRTALREGAGIAMNTANTPGVPPPIADPMRTWSVDATKLLLKMGLRGGRDSLNTTADEMNNDALAVQHACADAGTHA